MDSYLFFLTGGITENDPVVLLDNKLEIIKICDLILDECNIENYRLDAITYKAKILFAQGKEEDALALLENFPSFYHSINQRIEQLYPKNSSKFYNILTKNLYELSAFVANKLGNIFVMIAI